MKPVSARPIGESGSVRSISIKAPGTADSQCRVSSGDLQLEPVVKPVLRWAFWLFVFTMPFENLGLGFAGPNFSLAKLFGYLFLLIALTQPRICFGLLPRAFWCFALYLVAYLDLGILQDEQYWPEIFTRLLMLCQLLTFFWISYNLMRSDAVVRGASLTLAASCSVFAMLQAFGVGTEYLPVAGGDRVETLQTNPNTAGATYVLGLLALIGYVYGRRESRRKVWLVTWPFFFLLATQIVHSGSRGASVALAAGLLAFVVGRGSLWLRLRNILIVLLAVGGFVWISAQSVVSRTRWEATVRGGNLAKREKIFPEAWRMFLERPLTGWGPARHSYELGSRMGAVTKDTHNLYLWVLAETGLVGAVPFFLGLWLCLRMAWRARHSRQGIVPLALLLAVLVINASGTWHTRKLHWLVLAYALAGGSHFTARRPRGDVLSRSLSPDSPARTIPVSAIHRLRRSRVGACDPS